jgi:hypothetical protein
LVAVELDRLIAFRYEVTMPRGFHEALLCIAACQKPAEYVRVQAPEVDRAVWILRPVNR